jgi:hypothetical protein
LGLSGMLCIFRPKGNIPFSRAAPTTPHVKWSEELRIIGSTDKSRNKIG